MRLARIRIALIPSKLTHNEVQLGLGVDDLVELNDVRVLLLGKAREQADFKSQLLETLIVEFCLVDNFDSNIFSCDVARGKKDGT